jgi:hypothetical protein
MSQSGINWFVPHINCFVPHILHYMNCVDLCPYITLYALCSFIISYRLFMKMSTTAVGSGTALQAGRSQVPGQLYPLHGDDAPIADGPCILPQPRTT